MIAGRAQGPAHRVRDRHPRGARHRTCGRPASSSACWARRSEREKTPDRPAQAAGFMRRELGQRLRAAPHAGADLPVRRGARRHRPRGAAARRDPAAGAPARPRDDRRRGGVAAEAAHGVLVVDKPAGPDVPRRGGPRAPRAGRAPGRPHRHPRSLRHRRAARLPRQGHAAGALPHRGRQDLPGHRPPRLRHHHRRPRPASRSAAPRPVAVARGDVARAPAARLVGPLLQVPPAYSAKRVAGRARSTTSRGGRGGRAPRPVRRSPCTRSTCFGHEGDRVEIEVRCSAGTYVRALARDLGEALGTGGHLVAPAAHGSGAVPRARRGGLGRRAAPRPRRPDPDGGPPARAARGDRHGGGASGPPSRARPGRPPARRGIPRLARRTAARPRRLRRPARPGRPAGRGWRPASCASIRSCIRTSCSSKRPAEPSPRVAGKSDDPFSRARTHQALLSDRVRTLAYRRAIEAAVRPDDVVLDLGCGTGIFSLIAARRGCRKVYAVDRSRIIEEARETARRNGLEGRIEFIHAPLRRLELPERVDLIVHELIGSRFWDEEILESVARARERHLRPGGRLLPFRLDVLLAPTRHASELERAVSFWTRQREGFDLGAFGRLAFEQTARDALRPSNIALRDEASFARSSEGRLPRRSAPHRPPARRDPDVLPGPARPAAHRPRRVPARPPGPAAIVHDRAAAARNALGPALPARLRAHRRREGHAPRRHPLDGGQGA